MASRRKCALLLFAFLFLAISESSALHCADEDEHCHLTNAQNSAIEEYRAEAAKYQEMLATSNCSICNLGGENPCGAGKCVVLDKYKYVCNCPDDYYGDKCQHHIVCNANDCGENAYCTVFNHHKTCSCNAGYSGSPQYGCSLKRKQACARGDPHYVTFDGSHYNYQGTCPYVLSEAKGYYKLMAQNAFLHNGDRVSYITQFWYKSNGVTIYVDKSLRVYRDGARKFTPYYYPSIFNPSLRVTKWFGRVHIVDYQNDLELTYQSYQLCLTVPEHPMYLGSDKVTGLFGNIDDDCHDDFALANGTVLPNDNCNQGSSKQVAQFGDSWANLNDNCVSGAVLQNNTNCDAQSAQDQCIAIRHAKSGTGPFAACKGLGDDAIENYFNDCTYDMCLGFPRCDIFVGFARTCLDLLPFAQLDNWRNDVTECSFNCPLHSTYSMKTPICQDSCADPNYSNSTLCQDGYQEGCICDPGYYIDNNIQNTRADNAYVCRRLEDCGCNDEFGNYYPPHTTWLNGNCTIQYNCTNGLLHQVPVDCGAHATCSINTDGNYQCQCLPGYTGDRCDAYQPARHCADLYKYHNKRTNGVYNISVSDNFANGPIAVYCDMVQDGGGWTLVAAGNRTGGKTFSNYVYGFGDPATQNVWLGLDPLHTLTTDMNSSLRVVIERCPGRNVPDETTECTYKKFAVGGAEEQYRVHIPNYCGGGNETDPRYDGWVRWPLDQPGPVFTAFDNDRTAFNCSAEYFNTGWWFDDTQGALCGAANLNGLRFPCTPDTVYQGYLTWHSDPVENAAMYLRPSLFPDYDHDY